MATRVKATPMAELDRLRDLVAEQHRRLKVVRGELAPTGVALADALVEPLPSRCPKPRLTSAGLGRLIEEARALLELMDTTLGALHEQRLARAAPHRPNPRPTPGLAAYGLRSVPELPNLVMALFSACRARSRLRSPRRWPSSGRASRSCSVLDQRPRLHRAARAAGRVRSISR